MHEMHLIEVELRQLAKQLSHKYGDVPVAIIVSEDQRGGILRCITGFSFHKKSDSLHCLLGLLETAKAAKTSEALHEEATRIRAIEIKDKPLLRDATTLVIIGEEQETQIGSSPQILIQRDLFGIIESAKQIESINQLLPGSLTTRGARRFTE